MDRITFLAKVRNAALEPLWQLRSGQGSNVTWMGHLEERGLGPWPATRIIFLNDVYLCAKDVIRLLFHEADMACGLDLGPNFSVGYVVRPCCFLTAKDMTCTDRHQWALADLSKTKYTPCGGLSDCRVLCSQTGSSTMTFG